MNRIITVSIFFAVVVISLNLSIPLLASATPTVTSMPVGTKPNDVIVNSITNNTKIYTPPTGTVSGRVYDDANGNGILDTGESGMPGIQVWVYSYATGTTSNATSDSNGNYTINVAPGGIAVYEIVGNFINTEPGPAIYYSSITSGQTATFNFGNLVHTGNVLVTTYNDANSNGKRDPGESGSGIVQVSVYSYTAGRIVASDNVDGGIFFPGIIPGGIAVFESILPGAVNTQPGIIPNTNITGAYYSTLSSGQTANFRLCSILGSFDGFSLGVQLGV